MKQFSSRNFCSVPFASNTESLASSLAAALIGRWDVCTPLTSRHPSQRRQQQDAGRCSSEHLVRNVKIGRSKCLSMPRAPSYCMRVPRRNCEGTAKVPAPLRRRAFGPFGYPVSSTSLWARKAAQLGAGTVSLPHPARAPEIITLRWTLDA